MLRPPRRESELVRFWAGGGVTQAGSYLKWVSLPPLRFCLTLDLSRADSAMGTDLSEGAAVEATFTEMLFSEFICFHARSALREFAHDMSGLRAQNSEALRRIRHAHSRFKWRASLGPTEPLREKADLVSSERIVVGRILYIRCVYVHI